MGTGMGLAIACQLALASMSLRALWRAMRLSRWYGVTAFAIIMQSMALLLGAPVASTVIGEPVAALFGRGNLEDLLAHLCCLAGESGIMYAVLGRLGNNEAFRRNMHRYCVVPMTLVVPTMVGVFLISEAARPQAPNLVGVDPDRWLQTYWLLFALLLIHLSTITMQGLRVLIRDGRNRVSAAAYLICSVVCVVASALQCVTVLVPGLVPVSVHQSVIFGMKLATTSLLCLVHLPGFMSLLSRAVQPMAGDHREQGGPRSLPDQSLS